MSDSARLRAGNYNPSFWANLQSWRDWQVALLATVLLRVAFSLIGALVSPFVHPDPALIHSNALTANLPASGTLHYALVGIWQRFDTLWYLHIAQHGYDTPMAVIFYPLYPTLIRCLSWLLPPVAAALFLSTVFAFFSLQGLLRLSRTERDNRSGLLVLLLLSAWPTSFILFAGYAESLALALIVWAVAFAREDRWWLASICGLLAGLARPSGVLVCLPIFIIAARRLPKALPVLLSPAGFLGYWAWLRWSGRISVLDAYRTYQGTPFAWPWEGISLALRWIAHGDAVVAIKLGLIVLAAVFSFRREVRLEDKLYAAAVILQMFMYTGRPIIGAARYVLMVYPAFLGFAAYAESHWNRRQLTFYASALGALNIAWMIAFLNWSLVL